VEQHPGNIRKFVTTRLADLYGLLNGDTTRARAELAKHTTEIRMIPEAGAGGELHYAAEGNWDFFGGADFVLVAGECNGPSAVVPYYVKFKRAAA